MPTDREMILEDMTDYLEQAKQSGYVPPPFKLGVADVRLLLGLIRRTPTSEGGEREALDDDTLVERCRRVVAAYDHLTRVRAKRAVGPDSTPDGNPLAAARKAFDTARDALTGGTDGEA